METELKFFVDKLPSYTRDGKDKSTFAEEDSLPNLPVPDLNHTLDMYLDSAIVHLSPSEYRKTMTVVEDFRRKEGPALHKLLLKRAEGKRNWLEEIWNELAYFRGRYPLIPCANMNGPGPYFFQYWTPEEGTQLFRTAVLLSLLSEFREIVRAENLRVDRRANGSPLSMVQYRKIFNSCRIPGTQCDHLVHHFQTKTENSVDLVGHMIVISNGRMYKISIYDSKNKPLTIPEFHLQLKRVQEASLRAGPGDRVPLLTALERSKWAKSRDVLLSLDPKNKENLQCIESAVLCITLDSNAPQTTDEIILTSLRHGDGMVWADKSYSVMSFRNGIVAVSCDHAPMDGATLLSTSFYNDIKIFQNKGYAHLINEVPTNASSIPHPEELSFVLNDGIKKDIEESYTEFKKSGSSIDAILRRFKPWDRRLIRKKTLHPDCVVQMILQLAYYRLHRKPAPTYETATTRQFWHGRTETIRSCTPEVINWCRAMLELGCSEEERRRLFIVAYQKQNKWREMCESGHGCDRHLLGLMYIAQCEGLDIPELFTDPAWVKSGGNGNFILSTSTVGFTSVIGCVGAMHADGYGCFYRIGQEDIEMVITNYNTSRETNCHKLGTAFGKSMIEVKTLLDSLQINSKL